MGEEMRQQLARTGENSTLQCQDAWSELTSSLQARVAQADSAARVALEEQRRKLQDLQSMYESVQKQAERDRERMGSELTQVRECVSSKLTQVLEVHREAAISQAVSEATAAVSSKADEVASIATRYDERWRCLERHTVDINEKLRQYQEMLRQSEEKQRQATELSRQEIRVDMEGMLQQQRQYQLDAVQQEVRLQAQHLQQLLHPQLSHQLNQQLGQQLQQSLRQQMQQQQESFQEIARNHVQQERASLQDDLERHLQQQSAASWERLRSEQGHHEAEAADRVLRYENQFRQQLLGLQESLKTVQTDQSQQLQRLAEQLRVELKQVFERQQQTLQDMQGEQSQLKRVQVEKHMVLQSELQQLQSKQPRQEELLTQAYAEQAQLKQQWERQLQQARTDFVQQLEAGLNDVRVEQERALGDTERGIDRCRGDFRRELEKLHENVVHVMEKQREDTAEAAGVAKEAMEAVTMAVNAIGKLREDVETTAAKSREDTAKSREENGSAIKELASGLRALSTMNDEQLKDIKSRVDSQQEASCSLADGICGCENTVTNLEKALRPSINEAMDRISAAEEKVAEQDRSWYERFSNLEARVEGPMQERLRDYVRREFSRAAVGQLETQKRSQQELEQRVDKIVHAFHTPSGHEKLIRASAAIEDAATAAEKDVADGQALVSRRNFKAALGDSLYVRATLRGRGSMIRAASEKALVRAPPHAPRALPNRVG